MNSIDEFQQQWAEGETPPATSIGAAVSERQDALAKDGDEFAKAFEDEPTQEVK